MIENQIWITFCQGHVGLDFLSPTLGVILTSIVLDNVNRQQCTVSVYSFIVGK